MKNTVVSTPLARVRADLLVIGVYTSRRASPLFKQLRAAVGADLEGWLGDEGFRFEDGNIARLTGLPGLRARQILLSVVGRRHKVTAHDLRQLGGRAAAQAGKGRCRRIAIAVDPAFETERERTPSFDARAAQAVVEGVLLGSYQFDRYLSKESARFTPEECRLVLPNRRGAATLTEAMGRAEHTTEATNLARDLVNEPPNVAHPAFMLETARTLARELGLGLRVLGQEEMERRGMGCLLAVGRGSAHRPYLVHLTWRPEGDVDRRVVLVGKCLTFDSGGLDLKTAAGMKDMKSDMGGAAAVLGAIAGAARLGLPVEVHAVFAATENMTGAAAYRPDDVLIASNGKSVEIGNTDAEGRLTLADALVYAGELEPDVIVDVATLTGACVVALGKAYTGVFTPNQKLARQLIAAGEYSGDRMWQLPLPDEYRKLIRGSIADLKNTGGRWAGAITAALFLQEFVPQARTWVHLDIAGPCMADKPGPCGPRGATGAPTRALIEFLERL